MKKKQIRKKALVRAPDPDKDAADLKESILKDILPTLRGEEEQGSLFFDVVHDESGEIIFFKEGKEPSLDPLLELTKKLGSLKKKMDK